MYHGVSVGEVIALENLIKKTRETFPDYKIVVTTGTKTGQEIAQKKYAEIADFITYFPFDVTICVKSFLDKIRPTVVLIAETELWPTFSEYCKKKGISLYVINGRISDTTFKTKFSGSALIFGQSLMFGPNFNSTLESAFPLLSKTLFS